MDLDLLNLRWGVGINVEMQWAQLGVTAREVLVIAAKPPLASLDLEYSCFFPLSLKRWKGLSMAAQGAFFSSFTTRKKKRRLFHNHQVFIRTWCEETIHWVVLRGTGLISSTPLSFHGVLPKDMLAYTPVCDVGRERTSDIAECSVLLFWNHFHGLITQTLTGPGSQALLISELLDTTCLDIDFSASGTFQKQSI